MATQQAGLFTQGPSVEDLLQQRNTQATNLQQQLMAQAAQGSRTPAKARAFSLLGSSLGRALSGAVGGGQDQQLAEIRAKQAAQKGLQEQALTIGVNGTSAQQAQLSQDLHKAGYMQAAVDMANKSKATRDQEDATLQAAKQKREDALAASVENEDLQSRAFDIGKALLESDPDLAAALMSGNATDRTYSEGLDALDAETTAKQAAARDFLSTVDPDKYTGSSLNAYEESIKAGTPDASLLVRYEVMSSSAEKVLLASQDASFKAKRAAGRARTLAAKFRNGGEGDADVASALSSGVTARIAEGFKEFFGTQDKVSELRKEFTRTRNLEVINGLPPGVASDKDIELILAGFPNSDASPTTIANWLDSFGRIQEADAEFNRFKSAYISTNNNSKGFTSSWERYTKVPFEMVQKYRANRTMEGITVNFEKKYGFNPEGLL